MNAGTPPLSIVLRVIMGAKGVEACVEALRRQADRDKLEIIAPLSDAAAAELPPAYRSEIEVLQIPNSDLLRTLPPASVIHARCDIGSARGLAMARGQVIASFEDTATPSGHWVDAILEAHATSPHEAIGGPIDVDAEGALAWAAFWLDFGPYVPPMARGETEGLSDVNVSYKRSALFATRAVWADSFNEFLVHRAFREAGYRFLMLPQAAVTLRRPARPIGVVLAERYHWGRVFGAARRQTESVPRTVAHLVAAPVLPVVLAARVARDAAAMPQQRGRLIGAIPALLTCSAAWCAGEAIGGASGEPF